jgi:ribosomal protein S18 acetylase RimI-like enzyme
MVVIRRLVPADAANYQRLMLEAYARHPEAFTSSVAERAALPLSWWESRLATGAQAADVVLGAVDGERLAGVAGLGFETREKVRHKATLFGMYVPAEFSKLGLGRRLVMTVLEHAKSRGGIKLVQLTVTQGNTGAKALYERCGFAVFGIEPFAVAVGNGFVAKVHMWRDLETLDTQQSFPRAPDSASAGAAGLNAK